MHATAAAIRLSITGTVFDPSVTWHMDMAEEKRNCAAFPCGKTQACTYHDYLLSCLPCAAGKFAGGTFSTGPCENCTGGQYASVPGASKCTLCGKGNITNDSEAGGDKTVCTACAAGQYSPAEVHLSPPSPTT